jgi:hypothetical protein
MRQSMSSVIEVGHHHRRRSQEQRRDSANKRLLPSKVPAKLVCRLPTVNYHDVSSCADRNRFVSSYKYCVGGSGSSAIKKICSPASKPKPYPTAAYRGWPEYSDERKKQVIFIPTIISNLQ